MLTLEINTGGGGFISAGLELLVLTSIATVSSYLNSILQIDGEVTSLVNSCIHVCSSGTKMQLVKQT